MPLQIQKLKKVTIKAYTSRSRRGAPIGEFEDLYNPTSFSQKYEIVYSRHQAQDSSDRPARYSHSRPQSLDLKLILDGTGVNEVGLASLFGRKTVSDRVKEFLDLTFRMNGRIHEPNYLKVEWGGREHGGLIFSCRLESVNITYTSFDRDGSPPRASRSWMSHRPLW